jgi:hypothetical protein
VVGYDPVALWVNKFTDVKNNAWYFWAVAYVNHHGFMNGYGKGIFAPDEKMTRAMFVTVLWNIEKNIKTHGKTAFGDVAKNAWYYEAVSWAAENGIVNGISKDLFAPDRTITRQEMATMLFRYANHKKYNIPGNRNIVNFDDSKSIADWAEEAVRELSKAGVLNGIGENKFAPVQTANRAQAAQMFMNFMRFIALSYTADEPEENTFGF